MNNEKINKIFDELSELMQQFLSLNNKFPEKEDKIFLEEIEKIFPLENNLENIYKIKEKFIQKIEEKEEKIKNNQEFLKYNELDNLENEFIKTIKKRGFKTKQDEEIIKIFDKKNTFSEKKEFLEKIIEKRKKINYFYYHFMIIICMILIVFFVYQIGFSLGKNQGEKVFIFLPLALLSYLPIYIFYKKNTPLKNHKKSQVLSFLVNFFMILGFYTIFKSFFD